MGTNLNAEKTRTLDGLRRQPAETEWLEFKENHYTPELIGQYLSALSNSARLKGRRVGYLVFGVENATHAVKGTPFCPLKDKGKGNEDLVPWLTRGLDPRVAVEVTEGLYQDRKVVMFEVATAGAQPVTFYGEAFVRVGSSKQPLKKHPDLERRLWSLHEDWSTRICIGATLAHLSQEAMAKAREQFRRKHPGQSGDLERWDDWRFLAKVRLAVQGELTNAAILLLGGDEAAALLTPAQAWMTWSLKGASGEDLDYEHFHPPFLLNVDRLFLRVRNLRVRYLPDNTLFPTEVDQYDPWVIREALHNAIAHQDYGLGGRIVVVEKPDELLFCNLGDFLPGSVETVIREDAPPRFYRNPCLCHAMTGLGMIDTQGGGIRRMFVEQKKRCFPLPEYDLGRADEVRVRIPGRVIDSRYTRLLMARPDLEMETVMLLDRIQKGHSLTRDQYDFLRRQKLVEGRWGAFHLAASVADKVEAKAQYIRNRGLDEEYYQKLVLSILERFGAATRRDMDDLLLPKLPDVLNEEQKRNRVHTILTALRRAKLIRNEGSRKESRWVLVSGAATAGAQPPVKRNNTAAKQ